MKINENHGFVIVVTMWTVIMLGVIYFAVKNVPKQKPKKEIFLPESAFEEVESKVSIQ